MANSVLLYNSEDLIETGKLPNTIHRVSILDGSRLPDYLDSTKKHDGIVRKTLERFTIQYGDLTGSSPFMVVNYANEGLLPEGAKPTGRVELEEAIRRDNTFARGNYVDFGLALVTAGDSYKTNHLLAETLANDFKKRAMPLDSGKLISLSALQIRANKNSAYGLTFHLKDDLQDGAIWDLQAFKWIYGPRKEGLSSACLSRDRDWYSSDRYLDDSSSDGRVALVSAEGTSQKFLNDCSAQIESRKAKLEADRTNLDTQLEKIRKAQAALRGE